MSATIEPTVGKRSRLARARRIACIGLLAYVGVILMLLFLENRLVFLPTHPDDFWQDPLSADWQDVSLQTADGTRLHAWWCPYPGADSAMLYCHGNAGNLSHRAHTIDGIQRELRVSVLIFDYPGYGKSEGKPSEAGCYAAGEAAHRWLTGEQKIPANRILLFGNSLGGGVATHLAAKECPRALILSKTFTSIPDVGQHLYPWLPARWLMRNRFDSLARIKQCGAPVFITHGKLDEMIPYSHGEALFAAANEPKHFLPVDEGDHNAPLDREFFAQLNSFLTKVEAQPGQVAAQK